MTFERKKIRGEQLDQLVAQVEPLIQDLDLDFPIRIDDCLLADEERSIYYLSFFTGSGFLSPADKTILEKEGPYYFDGYENNPVTPYHWPAVEAIVTPTQAILFTPFHFSISNPEYKKVDREFFISNISIKTLYDPKITNIKSTIQVSEEIHDLIGEALYVYQQREDWIITTQLHYNFDIDMLKGLKNDND